LADEAIDILPKDKGDKFYGFKVSDLQSGGLVILGLGLAAVAAKVFLPDLFKPQEPQQEPQQQQQQQQLTPEQVADKRIAAQNMLRQQIVADNNANGGEVDVTPSPISNANYQDMSVDAISSRHERYSTDAPTVDSFDMEYEGTESDFDLENNPNLHKYVKTIND